MKNIRNKLIMGVLLGLAVLVVFYFLSDMRSADAYIRNFPAILILPVIGLTLFNYILRWVKWHYYLDVVGVRQISTLDSAAVWVSGFVLALSPGKAAELLKAAAIKGITGTPISRTAPIIIAERITDGIAMLLLGLLGFGGIMLSDSQYQSVLTGYIPGYIVIFTGIIGGIVILQIKPLFLWFIRLFEKIPLVGRFGTPIRELYDSSFLLFQPVPLAISVGLGIISWAGECVGFFLILKGLGIDPTALLLWQATFILAASSILGAVSGLPGGIGAAEFTIAGLIQLLVLPGAGTAFSASAALLIRLFTLWFAVFLGLLTAFIFRRRIFPDNMEETWRAAQNESGEPV